jgi:hypothetical protein
MAQQHKVSGVATNIEVEGEGGFTVIRYHSTAVVQFDPYLVILQTGGWRTSTTKTRMNQAASQFKLGYHVNQIDGDWVVRVDDGRTYKMTTDRFELNRKTGIGQSK